MKRKLLLALAVVVPLVLFLVARQAASWRPQKLGFAGRSADTFQFSPDGRWLVVSGPMLHQKTLLWDLEAGRFVRELPLAHFYRFSLDSRLLAVLGRVKLGSMGGGRFWLTAGEGVTWHDVRSGRKIGDLRAGMGAKQWDFTPPYLLDGAFSPDGKQLRVLTFNALRSFDVATGRPINSRPMNWSVVWKGERQKQVARFSPDGTQILHWASKRRLLDAQTGRVLRLFPNDRAIPDQVVWSPDGTMVAFCGKNALGEDVFLSATAKWVGVFSSNSLAKFVFAPDSRGYLLTTQRGIEVRSLPLQSVVQTLPSLLKPPFALAPDGSFALSIDPSGQLLRWRLK